ncbi:hypothetical protein SLS55_001677 [Diplodia seriata]|uniref:Uncharacterized protein n=1 Tax=Diplodia seriata TaxID=420778 RepID=A0ABR3CPZ1_9PEZI
MFALPDAKRVRRSDLFSTRSRSASPSPDPEAAAAILRARLDAQLGAAPVVSTAPTDNDDAATAPAPNLNDNHADEADELEFRLFATPAAPSAKPTTTPTPQQKSTAASAPVQKIRLRSPSLDPDQPGGFVNPSRPHSYYFAPALDDDASSVQKRVSAVSGADVLARAARIWRGCAVPWRVTVVDPSGRKLARVCKGHGEPVADADGVGGVGGSDGDDDGARQPGRRRKSKKARVALRKKHAKGLERKEAAARAAREKEEAERAKRMEKNRKQKLKRREKERARKAGGRGEAGGGGGGDGDVVMGED